jgi:hypothetical protein
MGFFQNSKAIILFESGGQRSSQEENDKKNQGLAKKCPPL